MTANRKYPHQNHRQRGVAAILSMMFLVILGSLAAAMAIVSQGNLATADSHIKINRSLAAAETGMSFMIYRLNQITANVLTVDGLIDDTNAPDLWDTTRGDLLDSLENEFHYVNNLQPYEDGRALIVPDIKIQGDNEPTFKATFTPHPIGPENYNSAYYQRPPYNTMSPPVSMANPLDSTWIRVRVQATDGPSTRPVVRSIQIDFKMDKKIEFAVLSKSRIMIGRNVMIEGPIGSRFTETHLAKGHPILMQSDFRGVDPALDADIDLLVNTLAINDMDGDNRLQLANSAETAGITNPSQLDYNGDGFIDDYDFFADHFDFNGDGEISATELDTTNNVHTEQLLELIDTFGDPTRYGYGDGVIDDKDRYAKIRGSVRIKADKASWEAGAANGQYQDYFQGPIHSRNGDVPLTFNASDTYIHNIGPGDFNVSSFRNMATGNLTTQSTINPVLNPDPNNPAAGTITDTSGNHREEVPTALPIRMTTMTDPSTKTLNSPTSKSRRAPTPCSKIVSSSVSHSLKARWTMTIQTSITPVLWSLTVPLNTQTSPLLCTTLSPPRMSPYRTQRPWQTTLDFTAARLKARWSATLPRHTPHSATATKCPLPARQSLTSTTRLLSATIKKLYSNAAPSSPRTIPWTWGRTTMRLAIPKPFIFRAPSSPACLTFAGRSRSTEPFSPRLSR